ncbi:MAG: signal peptidase II [Planctomycetaceae bacterium]
MRGFAFNERLALLLLWGSLIVGGDQSTKQYALNNLKGTADAPLVYMGGTLVIQYAENPGAFLSLLAKGQDALRFWVLTVANGIVLGGLSLFLIGTRQTNRWVWTALVLILMGGIGNLIDRIRLDGIVVDFINLGIGSLRTGIFNVADIAITAGFIMLLPTVFFGETPADDNGTPTTKEGTPTPVASAVTSTTSSVSTSGTLASGQSPETGEIG